MRGCSLSAWDSCHQAWDRVTLLSEPREQCWERHPSPQRARSKCDSACPVCCTRATCWAASPEHANLPSMAQAPGQAASAAPALHCRCAHRSASGAQPPPPAAARSNRAKDLASKAGRAHPSLTCMAWLHSTPFFPASCSLPPSSLLLGSRKFNQSLEEHLTCCCSQRSTLIPRGAEQIPGTESPPGCPDFLIRISPPELKPDTFKE